MCTWQCWLPGSTLQLWSTAAPAHPKLLLQKHLRSRRYAITVHRKHSTIRNDEKKDTLNPALGSGAKIQGGPNKLTDPAQAAVPGAWHTAAGKPNVTCPFPTPHVTLHHKTQSQTTLLADNQVTISCSPAAAAGAPAGVLLHTRPTRGPRPAASRVFGSWWRMMHDVSRGNCQQWPRAGIQAVCGTHKLHQLH